MGDARDSSWPPPKYHFSVEIRELGVVVFQEVSGLDIELTVSNN